MAEYVHLRCMTGNRPSVSRVHDLGLATSTMSVGVVRQSSSLVSTFRLDSARLSLG